MSLELRKSRIHGKGVFTTESIREHAVICKVVKVRTISDNSPLDPSKGELLHHCHWYPDGEMVLLDEPFCYFNHSCYPNMYYYTVNRSMYCLAMRDTVEDEELTLDYSLCNFSGKEWECHCGSVNCRGRHRCGFNYMDHSRQTQYLLYLDPIIVAVNPVAIQEILEKDLTA